MTIPTEPIGSIPRPLPLIEAVAASGDGADPTLDPLYEEAIRDTIERFEATGSPVITDGEQRKYHNFWTYCVHGLPNTAPDGFKIPFAAGSHAPDAAADGRAVSLQEVCRQLSGCRHALRARAGEAGGHLALGLEPDVSGRGDSRLFARGVHRRPAAASTKPRSAAVWKRARTRFRSTSPKAGWRSRSIPPEISSTASSI